MSSVMWEKGGLSPETQMGRNTGLSPALYQVFLGTLTSISVAAAALCPPAQTGRGHSEQACA